MGIIEENKNVDSIVKSPKPAVELMKDEEFVELSVKSGARSKALKYSALLTRRWHTDLGNNTLVPPKKLFRVVIFLCHSHTLSRICIQKADKKKKKKKKQKYLRVMIPLTPLAS